MLALLCVASSLALVALGGSDPTDGLHLQTLSFGRPTTLYPVTYMAHHMGSRMTRKIVLPFLWRPATSPPQLFTLQGHKAGSRSCATYIFPRDIPPFPRPLPYG
jgi:hypothetical protein